MSERTEAIDAEEEKTRQGGGPRYSYVRTNELERLGIDQYKSVKGDNYIRVIPPKDPKEFYGREIFVHFNIGADGYVYLCLKKMFGEPCPACEYREELKEKDPEDEKVKALAYSRRYLFFVYDVTSSGTEEKGLHWFDSPLIIKDNIVSLSKNRRTGETLDVSDPEEGRDVEFVRQGTGLKTKYQGFKLVEGKPIPKSWYQDIPTFDEILLKPDYDEVKQQVRGVASSSKAEETEKAADEKEAPSEQKDKTGTKDESKAETRGETRGESRSRGGDSRQSDDDGKKSVRDKIAEIRKDKKEESDD